VLNPGMKLGSYQIVAQIGVGGMGEVYEARDTELGRGVAIKVLPPAFVNDPERLSRFNREARMLAALNDPNIATIYKLEDSGGTHFLIMELVPGETLRQRMARKGPVPLQEALKIAVQIAQALEVAHEKGIIHRDLKPSNVKLTPDGKIKVLDFGLAKAFAGETGSDLSESPTVSAAATARGEFLGTAAYMSPEQARGKEMDKRTDIWSFGCLLYELLSGKQAFAGETVTDTIAKILQGEPDWTAFPANTPAQLCSLLRRCLQKDRTSRLRDVGDARIEIQEALGAPRPSAAVIPPPRRAIFRWALIAGLACLVAAALAGIATWLLKPSPTSGSRMVARTVLNLPPGDQLAALDYPAIAISPDGTQIAYVAMRGSTRQIYVRALDSLEPRPLSGTEGANTPFFSPDGQWLGFVTGGRLKKISLGGGPAMILESVSNNRGASWSSKGMIAFTPTASSPLLQISDSGGGSQALTLLQKGENSHRWPDFLPDGAAVLFTATGATPAIAVQSLRSGERRDLVLGGTSPGYASSGHLLYVQGGKLMAVAFDARRLQVTGTAVPVAEGVLQAGGLTNGSQYSISATGSLVYIPGGAADAERLVWVTRSGIEQPLAAPPHAYVYPRISHDGRRVAVSIAEQDIELWVYDLTRDTLSRLTFGGNVNFIPIWTMDGKRVAFYSNKEGPQDIFWELADGSGGLERLTSGDNPQLPGSFSPDGKLLAYFELSPTTGYDIWILRLSDHKVQPFLRSQFNEAAPAFSPDGRWLAYVSDESGRYEVYVQSYPGSGGKYQVSTEGGLSLIHI